MSLLTKWLESMHVDIKITNKCSRKRNVGSTCSFCLAACNQGAISYSRQSIVIDTDQCTSCGDCVIACPVSGIEGLAFTREFENQSLIYNPAYSPTVKELLIYKKRGLLAVQIDTTPINQQWETTLQQTNRILIDLKLTPIELEQKANKEILSRRALFTSVQSGGKKLAKSMAPASWKMEANEWNLANYYPETQFYRVELNKDKCTLCKACFTFCSQEVFHLQDTFLQIESDKCVNCSDCTDICLEDAIQIQTEIKERSELHEPIHQKKCQDCGQSFHSFQHETEKCPICVNRDPEWLSPYQ
ncbi:DUF362 domain-containing protein [Neobacillus drentensis]|uniref:DUF362 domain-containing protein n=1 Tax=Neobacillus drentensis TaxID=220684 RepID=UPI0030009AE3